MQKRRQHSSTLSKYKNTYFYVPHNIINLLTGVYVSLCACGFCVSTLTRNSRAGAQVGLSHE